MKPFKIHYEYSRIVHEYYLYRYQIESHSIDFRILLRETGIRNPTHEVL